MFRFRPLPWEYGIRNLFRRPLRTALTLAGLTTVVCLVFVIVGFIRGLEQTLAVSGDPRVATVFSLGMGENLEYSSIPMSTGDLVAASVPGIRERYGQKYVSPELYLGTLIGFRDGVESAMGLVRGITPAVRFVRGQIELEEGEWPEPGEALLGSMAAVKLGAQPGDIAIGEYLEFEGARWRVSGVFSAAGGAFESEVWCRIDELQQAMKRQDLSLVAVTLDSEDSFSDLDLFCKEQLALELQAIRDVDYYARLQKDYAPIRLLAWLIVLLVSGAGVFAGLNTMYGAVVGRVRELATLQTIGFARRAILASLIQEAMFLAAAATLLAALVAVLLVNGTAIRFTMSAFSLRIDSVALLIGCGVGFALGLLGAIPPAVRAFRMPVVDGLKSI